MQPSTIVTSFIVPTHDRPQCLAAALSALAQLARHWPEDQPAPEVIIVDNASISPVTVAPEVAGSLDVRVVRRPTNEAAAGRNAGAAAAAGEWLIMLDDDSHPTDCEFIEALTEADDDVAAVGADIRLASGGREAGGLPEVFIGCGVAIRRKAFLDAGGYDPAFHYYAEEYDLAAKLLLGGGRIAHDARFRVRHEKSARGRDMDRITRLLVRNNGWVAQRYAPDDRREDELREVIGRYGRMAVNEAAAAGYVHGLNELFDTLDCQPRRPMPRALFDRFTGLAHARRTLAADPRLARAATAAIIHEGKNAWAIRQALQERGVRVIEQQDEADALVIGTLSPGSLEDAWDRSHDDDGRVVRPHDPFGRGMEEARAEP